MSKLESLIEKILTKELTGNDCPAQLDTHPMLGRRCLIRTYSAGVHIGDVVYIKDTEVKLENAIRLWKWEDGGLSLSAVANEGIKGGRLWKWEDGGLSLSAVANEGIKGGRLNKTGEVYLTNVIEVIPTTEKAEKTYARFIE